METGSLKERDYQLDTIKGLLIFLVVFGHVLSHFKSDDTAIADYAYAIIYSFHMPAFCLISGYFSKPRKHSEKSDEKLLTTVFIPFVIFHCLMWALTSRSLGTLMTPAWTMWYLLCLFYWKLFVGPISKIRFALCISVMMAVLAGFTPAGEFMAISKAAAFFPFFLTGYLMNKEHMEKIRRWNKAAAALIFLLLCVTVVYFSVSGYPLNRVFTMKMSYESSGQTNLVGAAFRIFALAVGCAASFCLFALVPGRKTFLSDLGRNTITAYSGHSFTVLIVRKMCSFLDLDVAVNDIALLLFALAFAAAICAAFGNSYARKLYVSFINAAAKLLVKV